jgi:hypothetical protein
MPVLDAVQDGLVEQHSILRHGAHSAPARSAGCLMSATDQHLPSRGSLWRLMVVCSAPVWPTTATVSARLYSEVDA